MTIEDGELTRSNDILDAVWERLQRVSGFHTYRRGPITVQTQPEDLPLLAVFLPEVDATPWTDASMGPTCLVETVSIGISAVIIDSRSDAQYQGLVSVSEQLDDLFLRDPTFHSFELLKGIERRRKVTRSMQLAQTPVLELQYTFNISVINIWEPVIPDDLNTIHTTATPAGASEGTPPIEVVYDLTKDAAE
jgi:hypothetical protein